MSGELWKQWLTDLRSVMSDREVAIGTDVSSSSVYAWSTEKAWHHNPSLHNQDKLHDLWDVVFGKEVVEIEPVPKIEPTTVPFRFGFYNKERGNWWYQNFDIPIDVWHKGIGGPISGGIADYVVTFFAQEYAKGTKDPSTSEGSYYAAHFPSIEKEIRDKLREAYERKRGVA